MTDSTAIQAGTYRLDKPCHRSKFCKSLKDGDVVPITMTFVEGITFAEMRRQLEGGKDIKVTLKGLSDAEVLMSRWRDRKTPGRPVFSRHLSFFRRHHRSGLAEEKLSGDAEEIGRCMGAARRQICPMPSPYQALIMASIIEKETGRADERPLIGSVFVNRLKIPMRLQTDPTVIYGMGRGYDGNIRKRDLTADTPYNTYTRDGLPPTPIAMPGWGSLLAAVKAAQSDKLYFVARGDGSHYFSRSLDEHNRAVAKYQLGR